MKLKKKSEDNEAAKLQSAIAHSEDSRNSKHGYLETGNDATIHAKVRALNNNNNRTENVHREK